MNEAESSPPATLSELNWLVGHRFQEATRYEFSWSLVFDGSVSVTVECIWRLIENGRIRISVEDQGIGMDQKEVKQIFHKLNVFVHQKINMEEFYLIQ